MLLLSRRMNLDVVIDYKDEIDNFTIKKKNKKKKLTYYKRTIW